VGGVWSAPHPAALTPRKTQHPFYRADLDGCGKSSPHRDSILGSSRPSLYRLRYHGPCLTTLLTDFLLTISLIWSSVPIYSLKFMQRHVWKLCTLRLITDGIKPFLVKRGFNSQLIYYRVLNY